MPDPVLRSGIGFLVARSVWGGTLAGLAVVYMGVGFQAARSNPSLELTIQGTTDTLY